MAIAKACAEEDRKLSFSSAQSQFYETSNSTWLISSLKCRTTGCGALEHFKNLNDDAIFTSANEVEITELTSGEQTCPDGYFVTYIQCSKLGNYNCGSKTLHCKKVSENVGISLTSEFELTERMTSTAAVSAESKCKKDYYLVGLRCSSNDDCRYISMLCRKIKVCTMFSLDIPSENKHP